MPTMAAALEMSIADPKPMANTLDPLSLPLQGSQLIEASAGTGKTWTIAALYLRLVLGQGVGGRPLLPGEILVMTFTRAATRELSDRIRQRLVEAAAVFRGEASVPAGDGFLATLLAQYPLVAEGRASDAAPDEGSEVNTPRPSRATAAWHLAMAAEAMDDAAVHTIDAWCQRMLREHAFDSGCLFDEELQANPATLLATAVHDYWRQQVYPLAGPALATALKTWRDVDTLLRAMRALVELPLPPQAGEGSLQVALERALAERAQALAALKAGWAERAQAMREWLDLTLGGKESPLNRVKLKAIYYVGWLDKLKAWAEDPAAELPDLGKTAPTRLTPEGMQDTVKSGQPMAFPQAFYDFKALMQALPLLPQPVAVLRTHAAARVSQRMQTLKAQAGTFGFADMLQRLDEALDEARHGDKARRLRQRILQQYPVALIDEFQDTSPVQLRIFDRLYRIASNSPEQALLLIGDPKQAIYSFRGADIRSYLQARTATTGRHHVLGTNHRSATALVAAVNACFVAAEQRAGGAFGFRDEASGGADPLPFQPVAAKGRDEQSVVGADRLPAAPMILWLDTDVQSMTHSRERHAAWCAERIVQLLNDPHSGFVLPANGSQAAFRRVRPADIAVLVRKGSEATAVQAALRQRGVASVYLSDKDSVLASTEAHDVLRLLQAVAEPRKVALARSALATTLMGLSLAELLALATDDERFDARCEALQQLQAVWQGQGVLAMLRRALHLFGLPARWLGDAAASADQPGQPGQADAADAGERRITNVLHLAELLQAASQQVQGEQALIRWLAQQVEDASNGSAGGSTDEQVQRLESDADLVQVVTVHKSKGLEYPLVFLPFAAHFNRVMARGTPVVRLPDAKDSEGAAEADFDDANAADESPQDRPVAPSLSFAPTAEQLAQADRERLREDLRLLYVALTRARHALWVGAAALKVGNSDACQWHRSALGHLLSGADARKPDELAADIRALAAKVPALRVEDISRQPLTRTRLQLRAALPPLRPAPVYQGLFDRSWSISSYSALVKDLPPGSESPAAQAAAVRADSPQRLLRDDEPVEADAGASLPLITAAAAAADAVGTDAEAPWHRFPRGAFAGNFLHTQLEWLADEQFALDTTPALQHSLLRRCERQGWGHRGDDVLAWLGRVCATPMPAVGASLAQLDRTLPEMEFWLPSDGLRATAVDALCRQHILPGRARAPLPERALHGLLMGFADLVFEHEGRYGVLDYKSNALGAADSHYTPAAMEAAMLEHRYDVQAALYLLALHRLLRARLGAAYAPAQHLHGAVYLFLRGVNSASAGCFHLPAPLALINALDAMLEPSAQARSPH